MIDVENQIYTPIAEALREAFPGIDTSGEYVKAPSAFPHVSIVEQDNYPTLTHLSTSDSEEYATIMYEVNVYSNKSSGKKAQCRSIMKVIDDLMYRQQLHSHFPFPGSQFRERNNLPSGGPVSG